MAVVFYQHGRCSSPRFNQLIRDSVLRSFMHFCLVKCYTGTLKCEINVMLIYSNYNSYKVNMLVLCLCNNKPDTSLRTLWLTRCVYSNCCMLTSLRTLWLTRCVYSNCFMLTSLRTLWLTRCVYSNCFMLTPLYIFCHGNVECVRRIT